MPSLCRRCGDAWEAQPGALLCRLCLEAAEGILRELRSKEPTPLLPLHITKEFLKQWALTAVAEVRALSPLAHVIRGVIQGVLLSHELVLDSPEPGRLVQLELMAIEAMREVRG